MTFPNHSEDCHNYCFVIFGLIRSDYVELSNLCILFHQIYWFRCIGYSDCYFFDNFYWHWLGNQQTRRFRELLQWCHCTCCVPFWRTININCDCFCCPRGILRASSVGTCWALANVSREAVLTCIVKCGNCVRPCVVSIPTLLFFMKCNPIIGPASFFFTMNCSTNVLSPF